jgi:hypothetical protein
VVRVAPWSPHRAIKVGGAMGQRSRGSESGSRLDFEFFCALLSLILYGEDRTLPVWS